MTRGSWIQDDVRGHFTRCMQCKGVNPEAIRIQQIGALRHSVPAETLYALCPEGRSIYQSYLRWLAEPDE